MGSSSPASCSYHCPSCQHQHPCSNLPSWILLKINFKENWLVIESVPWSKSFMATSDTLGEREGKTVILIAWYNWPRSQLIDKYWIYLPSQPVPCCTQLRSSTFIYNYYRWQEGIENYHKPDFHSSLQIKITRRKAHLPPSPSYHHQLKNHQTAPTLCFSTTATSNEKKTCLLLTANGIRSQAKEFTQPKSISWSVPTHPLTSVMAWTFT